MLKSNEVNVGMKVMMVRPIGEPRYRSAIVTGETKTLWKVLAEGADSPRSFFKTSLNESGGDKWTAAYLNEFDESTIKEQKLRSETIKLRNSIKLSVEILSLDKLRRIALIIGEK